jgi:hypothetical protein
MNRMRTLMSDIVFGILAMGFDKMQRRVNPIQHVDYFCEEWESVLTKLLLSSMNTQRSDDFRLYLN